MSKLHFGPQNDCNQRTYINVVVVVVVHFCSTFRCCRTETSLINGQKLSKLCCLFASTFGGSETATAFSELLVRCQARKTHNSQLASQSAQLRQSSRVASFSWISLSELIQLCYPIELVQLILQLTCNNHYQPSTFIQSCQIFSTTQQQQQQQLEHN